jgi:exonuclease VII large subunit
MAFSLPPFRNSSGKCCLPLAMLLLAAMSVPLAAQSTQDPLTNDQAEQVRDTGDKPIERVKLYMKFIEERTAEIHKLATDPRAQSPNSRLHNLMEEFTRLADELQDNLETYSEEHADMRKTLKELVDHTAKWKTSLQEPKASADYDFARKTALDTADSTTELAQKMLDEQEKYFASHKAPK